MTLNIGQDQYKEHLMQSAAVTVPSLMMITSIVFEESLPEGQRHTLTQTRPRSFMLTFSRLCVEKKPTPKKPERRALQKCTKTESPTFCVTWLFLFVSFLFNKKKKKKRIT